MPDRLRERLTILQGAIALSQGPPLPPHVREAAAIRGQFETAMAAYHAFLERTSFTTRSTAGGLRMKRFALTLLVAFSVVCIARAGTTGGISGVVTEAGTTTPIAGVA